MNVEEHTWTKKTKPYPSNKAELVYLECVDCGETFPLCIQYTQALLNGEA